MTQSHQSPGTLTEDQLLEIIAYLVSSAETSLSEPSYYAIFRLIDATSRIIDRLDTAAMPRTGAFLDRYKAEVDQKKVWMMWDLDAFFAFVKEAPALVAAEAKRLSDLDAKDAKETAA